jgi:hypothetical protein
VIDDLSQQLNSLAATVDRAIDLPALHRRISHQRRRRTVVRVGVATGGVAAVVGGLLVVGEAGPTPASTAVSATDQGAAPSTTAAAPPLPDCAVLLASQRASATTGTDSANKPTDGFKGMVSIAAIDASTITVSPDEPTSHPPDTRTVILDAATEWTNGPTTLDAPTALHVGDTIGIATLTSADGVEHAMLVDTGAAAYAEAPTVDFKGIVSIVSVDDSTITVSGDQPSNPLGTRTVVVDAATEWRNGPTTLEAPAALHVGDTVGVAALAATDGAEHAVFIDIGVTTSALPSAQTDTTGIETKADGSIVLPGPPLATAATSKSLGTITAVTDTSITVTLDGGEDSKTATVDLASTPFYADAGVCRPTGLTVDTKVGIAFHLDDTSSVVADAILLIP